MSASELPAARSALPLYLLSLGGLAACIGTSLLPLVADLPPASYLPLALPVAGLALAVNAASLLSMMRTCSGAAQVLRASAGIEDKPPTGHALARLVQAVQQVDAVLGERQREIERLNHADPLTGLGNRRWLQIVASRAFAQAEAGGRGLSALVLRVDHLQEINQRHGHDAGDRALLGCADMLRRLVRRTDCLARISGNEFLVLLPATREEAAGIVGRRIADCLASFPQSLLGDAPLVTRMAVAEWRGEKMLEALLARTQAQLDALPLADAAALAPAIPIDDAVAAAEEALTGVRPAEPALAGARRRLTDG